MSSQQNHVDAQMSLEQKIDLLMSSQNNKFDELLQNQQLLLADNDKIKLNEKNIAANSAEINKLRDFRLSCDRERFSKQLKIVGWKYDEALYNRDLRNAFYNLLIEMNINVAPHEVISARKSGNADKSIIVTLSHADVKSHILAQKLKNYREHQVKFYDILTKIDVKIQYHVKKMKNDGIILDFKKRSGRIYVLMNKNNEFFPIKNYEHLQGIADEFEYSLNDESNNQENLPVNPTASIVATSKPARQSRTQFFKNKQKPDRQTRIQQSQNEKSEKRLQSFSQQRIFNYMSTKLPSGNINVDETSETSDDCIETPVNNQ
jgi:hypothetical protein